MKRLTLLVMPLMAISFLASCNKGNWWNKTKSLTKADIGKIEKIKVNGQVHKVRLIGIDEDKDEKGNIIHTTWEFANLISDDKGHSIVTQWNDSNFGSSTANHNYLESTLRNALVGDNDVFWAQKGETSWSKTYKHSVLSMLPKDFSKVLKSPTKIVNVYTKRKWVETTFNDKLFLLTPREMGFKGLSDRQETSTTPYTYYQECTTDTNSKRIKRQANESEIYDDWVIIPSDAGQIYKDLISNVAGHNTDTDGCWYWLRSPDILLHMAAWNALTNGKVFGADSVGGHAEGVAPAFCI